ncbi:hypothetical protein B9Z55_000480 [Caenorhabditis nigoni]|uniref:Tetratricopeptide repeat protein 5 OB fold domain-containing protein n=1 Tax=Caenorhabditis nigoni TaxID=1611254 RepID=A0A2G5VTD1_9PELO|nr:hypothetical protein B9Z55_000480 [Caenorhabditis nigoni]
MSLKNSKTSSRALVGVDVNGEVYGITVYNCLSNFGFVIGDTVTIAKPDFRELKFSNSRPAANPRGMSEMGPCGDAHPDQEKRSGTDGFGGGKSIYDHTD